MGIKMPHINLKLYSGRSEADKVNLASNLAKAVSTTLGVDSKYITVAIEDVQEKDWADKVYNKEITPNRETLYIKPGY